VSGPERDQRTVVAVVFDDRGWMICGNVDGVAVDTPKPLSAAAAANYLRLLLPDLFRDEPQHLTAKEIAALDRLAEERLGPEVGRREADLDAEDER
jgi:hypothetical protein